ncbi:MAG: arginine--tRNA ligase [Bacteroidetes bacterium]|nr:arginine--tRNA ligase [Bacteroidota bacterium]
MTGGIHICKSMLAWKLFGNGETPQSSGIKGDHLVGKYYVQFDRMYKEEIDKIYNETNKIIHSITEQITSKRYNSSEIESKIKETLKYFTIKNFIESSVEFKILKVEANLLNEITPANIEKWVEMSITDHQDAVFVASYLKMLLHKIDKVNWNEVTPKTVSDSLIMLFKETSTILFLTQEMLRKWEQGDKETIDLWKMMNGWVYDGFDVTYKNLGIDFDKIYYESDTYLLGKKIVEEGLQKKIFTQDADNSVWLDLTDEGLDRKIMQRSDGTSVYITQDLGTATLRHKEFDFESMIYVVGNEQDYHFKVLFKALKKLGYNWADKCRHLSYAMVDLPSGKMKSREGTVVDADELMQEVIDAAKAETQKLGKVDEFSAEELNQLYKTLGMGALKYFILKVDPEKRMLFNPEESVEIHGNTGPYIQYVHARICSMLRSAGKADELSAYAKYDVTSFATLNDKEKELVKTILSFVEVVIIAAQKLSPALVANYVYELSRVYNQFYHDNTVIDKAETETSLFRLQLSSATAQTIKKCMELLGIDCPERM